MKIDAGWPDAVSKIVLGLLIFLIARCDSQRQARAIAGVSNTVHRVVGQVETNAAEINATEGFLKFDRGSDYVDIVKKAIEVGETNQRETSK